MSEQPLHSMLRDDPEMLELIAFFLDELGERVSAISRAMQQSDAEQLRRIAHQLKGAAGGYGYPSITEAARAVEDSIDAIEGELSGVTEQVESLVELCRRAAAARADG
jgi:HPt (histidine-containing phosphotransfer) domain-containing protein